MAITDDVVRTPFHERLAQLRRERKLSLNRLAKLSGLDRCHVRRLEWGLHAPSCATAERLADALGVSLDVLTGRV